MAPPCNRVLPVQKLDREREELKRMRVSKRAPNAPIASSDEEGGGELLDALGKGGLYGGSSQQYAPPRCSS